MHSPTRKSIIKFKRGNSMVHVHVHTIVISAAWMLFVATLHALFSFGLISPWRTKGGPLCGQSWNNEASWQPTGSNVVTISERMNSFGPRWCNHLWMHKCWFILWAESALCRKTLHDMVSGRTCVSHVLLNFHSYSSQWLRPRRLV